MPAFMGFCNVPFSVAGCNRRHSSHHCRWQFRRDSASHVHAADVVRGTSMAQRRGMAAALLWLADYRVVVEGRVIEGLSDDVSALTYDPDRKTLFTVTNKSPERSNCRWTAGVLRHIALHGFGDAEAVEYIRRDTYVISDERQQRLFKVRISEDTQRLDAADSEQFSLGIGRNGNKGFEGLAYDPDGRRLFVAKERDPLRIYEIQGFPRTPGRRWPSR